MASSSVLAPFIRKWEGGFANIPNDPGGATKWGVTLNTYRIYYGMYKTVNDLKNMTEYEWNYIFTKGFWDKALATQIVSQSVANMLVDFGWNCGMKTAIKTVQRILGCTQDGIMGPITMGFINRANARDLFNKLYEARKQYYKNLVLRKPSMAIFLKGWMNRINDLKFTT